MKFSNFITGLRNRAFPAVIAAAASSLLAIPSFAQTQGQGNVTGSGWFKTCNEQGENKICNVQYRIVTNQGNQLITSLNLIEVDGSPDRRVFRIIVPTGRSLPEGVQVQVDGKRSVVIPYAYCRPQVCAAEARLNDELVSVFKAGGGLEVTSLNFQSKQNVIPVTLQGFTAAYDGPPLEVPDATSREEQLKKELEEKLKQQQAN